MSSLTHQLVLLMEGFGLEEKNLGCHGENVVRAVKGISGDCEKCHVFLCTGDVPP